MFVDLDTLSSSISYAYLSSITSSSSSASYIPLSVTTHSDFYLRRENLYALSLAGLSHEDILCMDDLPSTFGEKERKWTLVDHNRLDGKLKGKVVGILDHHVDEEAHMEASPRKIEATGSCASLVTQHFAQQKLPIPPSAAKLLLSAILIDTNNLASKAIEADFSAVQYLQSQSSSPTSELQPNTVSSEPSNAALTSRLNELKLDLAGLEARDLLRRDYKEYSSTSGLRWGLSTVPMPLTAFLSRLSPSTVASLESSTASWMAERSLSLSGILTTFREPAESGGKHRRELMICVKEGEGLDDVFEKMEEDGVLELKKWKDADGEKVKKKEYGDLCRVWRQGNTKATRKQVAPILKGVLERLGKL
ncbi:DHH phosphoesterase [Atractiella rhizophila]|nr:DHH phosphoesterase [Atractiella rhizophila]